MTLYPLLHHIVDAAVAVINSAIESDSPDHTLHCLLNEDLSLSDVDPANALYYHRGLLEKKRSKPNGRLTEEDIQECIREMNDKADLDRLGELGVSVF